LGTPRGRRWATLDLDQAPGPPRPLPCGNPDPDHALHGLHGSGAVTPGGEARAAVRSRVVGHRLRRGLDLPLAGEPEQAIHPAGPCTRVALLGADHVGLKPTLHVQPGTRVLRGQLLFEDKKTPAVRFTAPAAGSVVAIHRGERRSFESLVIEVDAQVDASPDSQCAFSAYRGTAPERLGADEVRALLLESGLWTSLRTRPFSRVPDPATSPRALFITAMDTRPHAPAVDVVLAGREADFEAGVTGLARLTGGPTYVCVAADSKLGVPAGAGATRVSFEGPHPAGLPGTHIHLLSPVDLERTVWHVGYQDVAAIGKLFNTGRLDVQRVISLAGPSVLRPRLLRTRLGACIDELVREEIAPANQRVISGSVLDGRIARGEALGYLGRHHVQVSVLAEAAERELFGWIMPGFDKFSIWGVVAGAFTGRAQALTTTTNGGARAMVPIGSFERVMPLDLMPTFLLRALLTGNDERAEALGALELDEDDLALCTFVCPGKAEYGPLLRAALSRIEKEAA
jgi:Na+-transporting NADH:ubiquinone oxidoreductase subunit A